MSVRQLVATLVAVPVAVVLLVVLVAPSAVARPTGRPSDPDPTASDTPAPDPDPDPDPTPTVDETSPPPAPVATEPPPAPSVAPTTPQPSPTPTEVCIGQGLDDGAVSFGDVDADCDGTLLLSEQGEPISIRRTVVIAPRAAATSDASASGASPSDGFEVDDRFEPTEFVPGTLVDFDTESEQGGTITEGSLIYTPPPGFVGTDRFTFFVRGPDDVTREAEVLVDVREGEPGEPVDSTEDEPGDIEVQLQTDAVDRVLGAAQQEDDDERWDPPWLLVLGGIAVVLVVLAVVWWLFLVVRVQDRFRDGGRVRR